MSASLFSSPLYHTTELMRRRYLTARFVPHLYSPSIQTFFIDVYEAAWGPALPTSVDIYTILDMMALTSSASWMIDLLLLQPLLQPSERVFRLSSHLLPLLPCHHPSASWTLTPQLVSSLRSLPREQQL